MKVDKLKSITPKILRRPIKRHIAGRRSKVNSIVLHTMDGPTDKSGNLQRWFNSEKSGGAAHMSVGFDGTIISYVDFEYIILANSDREKNLRAISIEFADDGNPNDSVRTDKLYEKGGLLIAYLVARFDMGEWAELNKNVFLHRQFHTTKSCPGNLDYERLIRIANKHLRKMYADLENTLPVIKPDMATTTTLPEVIEASVSENQKDPTLDVFYNEQVTEAKDRLKTMKGAALYGVSSIQLASNAVALLAYTNQWDATRAILTASLAASLLNLAFGAFNDFIARNNK